jgi:hypothetical protein
MTVMLEVRPSSSNWRALPSMINWIKGHVPLGRTILELGSGDGTTRELCRGYRLFSVEHNQEWLNRYPSHYIYAPLERGWYSGLSRNVLPDLYDLLIIDGPPGKDREGIIQSFGIFRMDAAVVIDDVEREPEKRIIKFLLERGYTELARDKRWVALRNEASIQLS